MANQDVLVKASGGDFTTVQGAVDSVAAQTGDHIIRLANEQFNESVAKTGALTATSITLKPDTGAFHNGTHANVGSTGCEIKSDADGSACINIVNIDNFIIERGISFTANSATHTAALVAFGASGSNESTGSVDGCIYDGLGNSSANGAVQVLNLSSDVDATNNVIYDHGRGIDYRSSGNAAGNIYGNTARDNGAFGILGGTAALVKMNISAGHSSNDFFATTGNHDYNISEDASAAGANSIASVEILETGDTPTGDYVAFVNLTAGSENYDLVDLEHGSHTQVALDAGTSGLLTEDCIGVTRSVSTPDIGAFELVGASPPTGGVAGGINFIGL